MIAVLRIITARHEAINTLDKRHTHAHASWFYDARSARCRTQRYGNYARLEESKKSSNYFAIGRDAMPMPRLRGTKAGLGMPRFFHAGQRIHVVYCREKSIIAATVSAQSQTC